MLKVKDKKWYLDYSFFDKKGYQDFSSKLKLNMKCPNFNGNSFVQKALKSGAKFARFNLY